MSSNPDDEDILVQQIETILARLERRGVVESRVGPVRGRIYRLTKVGGGFEKDPVANELAIQGCLQPPKWTQ